MLSACHKKTDAAATCSAGFAPYLHPFDADSAYVTTPTAFTPNGDGRDDDYHILTGHVDSSFSYTVENSSGAVMFTYPNSGGTNRWDGTVSGAQVPAGTYTARVHFRIGGTTAADTCSQFLLLRPNASGCLESHGQAGNILFEDQIDNVSGHGDYATGEVLCN